VGIWLEAPESILVARTEQRRHDPSDANADVVRLQHRQPIGEMTWHRVDASSSPGIVTDHATRLLTGAVPGGDRPAGHGPDR
jgi:predicted kinase